MKTLGLLGGMSWESTALYYRRLNELVRERLGGHHSAPLLLWSADFAPIVRLQEKGEWDAAASLLARAAQALERAGAEAILIGSNTMHRMAPEVAAAVSVPLLHLVDATAQALAQAHRRRPLLLATRYTMEQSFWRERLATAGPAASIPEKADRDRVHGIILEELVQGRTEDESRREILAIIARSPQADSVILGCTELGLVVSQADLALPLFDTTEIHVRAALDWALS